MKRFLPSLAAFVLAAAAPAAQDAEATLYTRVEGDTVRALIVVDVEPGAHIYHGPERTDLGHPQAVGLPTTFELGGEGISWGPVIYPEPFPYPQEDFGAGVFINCHDGEVLFFATGTLDAGASGDDATVDIDGLCCDEAGCLPWSPSLESEGKGPDDLWAEFPEPMEADAPEAVGAFTPRGDEHSSGEADATLYTRISPDDPHVLQGALEIEIAPGWHLYHFEKGNDLGIGTETTIKLGGEGIEWGELRWPTPIEVDQRDVQPDTWIWGHEGTIVIYAEGRLTGGADGYDASAEIEGQTCEEVCTPYEETAYTQGPGPESVWAALDAERAPANAPEDENPLAPFLLEAVLWGLITLLMPCTYPMIPITISFFTKQAEARGGQATSLSLAYGAGIVLIFALIGVVVGPAIVPFAQGGWLNLVIGLLFLYFALVLLGYVNLQPPRFLMNAAGKASTKGGFLGVFLMGACLVVTSFTCTAPFVGTLLARGATEGDIWRVVAGMSVFGLTMAIPFVVLSLVPGKIQALPRSGQWMNTLKVTLGFVEIAAALKFLSNADLAWGWNLISREMFLALWALIFLVASLYLFGVLRLKGSKESVGVKRGIAAALFLVFAGYNSWGLVGNKMDFLMTTMAPPYSGGVAWPTWYEFGGEWTQVVDDFDEAVEVALAEDKLVFVNFTGHT